MAETDAMDTDIPQQPTDGIAPPIPTRSSQTQSPAPAAISTPNAQYKLTPPPRPSDPTSPSASHGAAIRQYLNDRVSPHLLEGMKMLAKTQPTNPLEVLGRFLLSKSAEVEGTTHSNEDSDNDPTSVNATTTTSTLDTLSAAEGAVFHKAE